MYVCVYLCVCVWLSSFVCYVVCSFEIQTENWSNSNLLTFVHKLSKGNNKLGLFFGHGNILKYLQYEPVYLSYLHIYLLCTLPAHMCLCINYYCFYSIEIFLRSHSLWLGFVNGFRMSWSSGLGHRHCAGFICSKKWGKRGRERAGQGRLLESISRLAVVFDWLFIICVFLW